MIILIKLKVYINMYNPGRCLELQKIVVSIVHYADCFLIICLQSPRNKPCN